MANGGMQWAGPAVMAWLSGMFTTVWTYGHSEPTMAPATAAVFAVITAMVAVIFGGVQHG